MDTINGMRTFLSVVDAGSFTAAAKRQEMSVALVSKYVGQLEERLGVRLLNRTTRSLTLTELGKVYFDRAQQLIEDFDDLENVIKDKQQTPSGKLIVAAPVGFGETFITPAISAFMELHPLISIDLQLTDRFISLTDENVDVAIRISELPDANFIARRLTSARVVCCATKTYLHKYGIPTHPSHLAKHDCIIDKNFRESGNWVFLNNNQKITYKVTGRFSVNSARAARTMVLADKGIALIPVFEIKCDLENGSIDVLLEEFEAYDFGVYAIYPHRRHLAVKTRFFVNFMIGFFAKNTSIDPHPLGLVDPKTTNFERPY